MPSYGQTVTLQYIAWDTVANAGKTGDVANHTLKWVKDGTSATPTNNPAEVDATNAPGVYKLVMTGTEASCQVGTLAGKSSTSGVAILPITVTFENLPTAAPNAANGLPTVGTGAGQINLDGSGNVHILGSLKANTALNGFQFLLVDSSKNPVTSATVTATRSIDGAAFGACANAASEIGAGWYKINLAAADLNGKSIKLAFAASGAETSFFDLLTTP